MRFVYVQPPIFWAFCLAHAFISSHLEQRCLWFLLLIKIYYRCIFELTIGQKCASLNWAFNPALLCAGFLNKKDIESRLVTCSWACSEHWCRQGHTSCRADSGWGIDCWAGYFYCWCLANKGGTRHSGCWHMGDGGKCFYLWSWCKGGCLHCLVVEHIRYDWRKSGKFCSNSVTSCFGQNSKAPGVLVGFEKNCRCKRARETNIDDKELLYVINVVTTALMDIEGPRLMLLTAIVRSLQSRWLFSRWIVLWMVRLAMRSPWFHYINHKNLLPFCFIMYV